MAKEEGAENQVQKTRAEARDGRIKKKLSDREKRFVDEYCSSLDPVQALYRAGYDSKNPYGRAHSILKRPHVKHAVKKLMAIMTKQIQAHAFKVIRELSEIAYSDLSLIKIDEKTGEIIVPPDRPGLARAIASIDRETIRKGDVVTHKGKIRLWSKTEALTMLGKHLQMWTDKEAKTDERPILIIRGVDPDAALGVKPVQIEVMPPAEVVAEPIKLIVERAKDGAEES